MVATWLLASLGTVGALCFALMMVPQVVLNARRCSTEGLSLGLVLPWHAAGVIFAGGELAAKSPSLFSILSFAAMVFFCGTCEVQRFVYQRSKVESFSCCKHLALVAGGSLLVASASGAVVTGFYFITIAATPQAAHVLSGIVPSILLAVGFLPEFHEFWSTKSIEGYSFGVTFFDIVGSAANSAIYFATQSPSKATASSAPFLTIIIMHVLLVCLAIFIVCFHSAPGGKPEQEADPNPALQTISRSAIRSTSGYCAADDASEDTESSEA